MRRFSFLAGLALAIPGMLSAQNTLDVQGVTYQVDTTFHAKVGPGTTQTSLKLTNTLDATVYPLVVHYVTIDRTAPNVSIRALKSGNKIASMSKTSTMAENASKNGINYFCGVNADFFTVYSSSDSKSMRGESFVGRPSYSCVVDGKVVKTSNGGQQFIVDTKGEPYIFRAYWYAGKATSGSKTTSFRGMDLGSPDNALTVYSPAYVSGTNVAAKDNKMVCEVTAKAVAGTNPMSATEPFKLEVTGTPSTAGDMTIPSDGYVISSRYKTSKKTQSGFNTAATDFVQGLKVGDIVEFTAVCRNGSASGATVIPQTIVSGNPKCLGNGQTLETLAERTDAKDRHPRTSIGYSKDKKNIIMMVIEGRRAGISVGVSTKMEADIMRYAGASEAMNLDGGGSSTLYTQSLGIRNHCTDTSGERAVTNAVYAVLDAPEDNEVAEISFADWRKDLNKNDTYLPVIYAFNKHGLMINKDFKGFTLSCEGGTVSADGKEFKALKDGVFGLKATYNGITTAIPVKIGTGAAVEGIEADVADANQKWYDLQGNPVNDITVPGVYVSSTGKKIIVK